MNSRSQLLSAGESRNLLPKDRGLQKANAAKRSEFRKWIWLAILASPFALWSSFSTNAELAFAAIIVLAIVIGLLWQTGEPPVLVFACGVQWLQASLSVFYANHYHVPVVGLFGADEGETASWLSLVGVLTVAVGMRVGLLGGKTMKSDDISRIITVNPAMMFSCYLGGFFLFSGLQAIAFVYSGVTQIILAFANLKLALLFLLFYSVLEQRRGYVFLVVALCLEMAVGFLGYFAAFKSVFFVLFISLLTCADSLRGKRGIVAGATAIAVIALGIFWTSVKGDYRNFLGEGGAQQPDITFSDRADKLWQSTTNFSWEQVDQGFEQMVGRISYLDYFVATLQTVPREVPYENGALWADAWRRIVMPRLLFPDKASINDSERTNYYTGSRVAGTEANTSIGIGYMAESYIDFGPVYMFVPILVLGALYGLIYRFFIRRKNFRLLGFALGVAVLLPAHQDFEASNAKIVGGIVVGLIVSAIVFELSKKQFPYLK